MMSMFPVAALLLTSALACPDNNPPPSNKPCKVRVCEHHNGQGDCRTFNEGSYGSLGSLNNKISSYQFAIGSDDGCILEYWTENNFRGIKSRTSGGHPNVKPWIPMPTIPNMNDRVSSLKLRKNRRRRRADVGLFADFDLRDPLCEWILQDGLDGDWSFGDSQEAKDEEIEKLLDECYEEFGHDDAAFDQCQFYVHAAAAFYSNEDLVEDLRFSPELETAETEYMRCGVVTTKINDAIEQGKLSGITLLEGEDGGEDMFVLDEAFEFDNHPVYVENNGVISTLLSVGALISVGLSSVLVRVCRDFDPITHEWLLA